MSTESHLCTACGQKHFHKTRKSPSKSKWAFKFTGNPDGNKSHYKPVPGWSDFKPSEAAKNYMPVAKISYITGEL